MPRPAVCLRSMKITPGESLYCWTTFWPFCCGQVMRLPSLSTIGLPSGSVVTGLMGAPVCGLVAVWMA